MVQSSSWLLGWLTDSGWLTGSADLTIPLFSFHFMAFYRFIQVIGVFSSVRVCTKTLSARRSDLEPRVQQYFHHFHGYPIEHRYDYWFAYMGDSETYKSDLYHIASLMETDLLCKKFPLKNQLLGGRQHVCNKDKSLESD